MANRKLTAIVLAAALSAFAQSPAPSADPRVKFKDGERYLRDLAAALEMPRETICKELSQYDCFHDAFKVVLGGVEPYRIRIVEPLETASMTSPIAVDRVALHACSRRVHEDQKDPSTAVLFRLPRKADKKWKAQTAATLYDRLLRRDPTPAETARMVSFYDTVAKSHNGSSADIARDWVAIGCFTLATSLESIFY
jgi:hypothetical protein